MRLSLPAQRLLPLILLAALAAAFLALAAGRLGGGSGGESASAVLDRAFETKSFRSGRFAATVNVSIEGGSNPQAQSFGIALEGAFANAAGAPKSDFDMSFSGLGQSLGFGFVSTGKEAFLELGNRAYRVPPGQLEELKKRNGGRTQSFAGLGALGVDPRGWLVDPTSQGSAKIGGIDTNHISAGVDTAKLVRDFLALGEVAERSGAQDLSATDRSRLEQSLERATVDIYTAKSDGTLRKLTGQARIDAPADGGDIRLSGKGTLSFTMEFEDVNEPQKISAPKHARPFTDFQQDFSRRLLAGLSGAGGSVGSPSALGAGGESAPAPALPGSAQTYLDCVQKARTNAQLQQCAHLLD
jgi:hypothetical protein